MKVIFYANEIYGQCFDICSCTFHTCLCIVLLSIEQSITETFPLARIFFHISVLFNYVQLINLLDVFT